LLVLCLEFSSYFWFLQESQKIGRQQVASPCDARSEQQVCCLLADQRGGQSGCCYTLDFATGEKPKGREQRQGEVGGGGTEQFSVEVGEASSKERRVCEGGLALARLGGEGRSGQRGRVLLALERCTKATA
jgi:hypothetical protein